jgi:hypothetical protein
MINENKIKTDYKKFCQLDHPFPNEEIKLLMKIHKEDLLKKEDYEVISNLLHKYLNLRADVFHED